MYFNSFLVRIMVVGISVLVLWYFKNDQSLLGLWVTYPSIHNTSSVYPILLASWAFFSSLSGATELIFTNASWSWHDIALTNGSEERFCDEGSPLISKQLILYWHSFCIFSIQHSVLESLDALALIIFAIESSVSTMGSGMQKNLARHPIPHA